MPDFAQSIFPTCEDVLNLVRSIVNDTFKGVNQLPGEGRIFTDDAAFTLPLLNNAFRTLQRKLRIGGVTFPIKEAILYNLTPVVAQNADVFVNVSYNGYFDGTAMHASPALPSDLMQPYFVWEQCAASGSTLGWSRMFQPQKALCGGLQSTRLTQWEWRGYALWMPGSLTAENIRIKYQSGQPPLTPVSQDFSQTSINIADSADALAFLMAAEYSSARGAADVTRLEQKALDAINDMIAEYVRQSQTNPIRRGMLGTAGRGTILGGWGTR